MTGGIRTFVVVIILVGAAATACTGGGDSERSASDDSGSGRNPIVVGSFDFSESRILAEVYATALEDHGYPVRRLRNVGAREIMEPALEQDFVDLMPEYMGTALAFLGLGGTVTARPRETHERLAAAFADRGVAVLEYAPAENKNEVVVKRETADEFGLRKISDLRRVASDMILGGPPECPARPLCLEGLQETYGLQFQAFRPLDVGGALTVAALEGGEVDAAILFTTNPAIISRGFVVLRDDLGLQPSENVVPVVRQEVADAYGTEFAHVVNSVTGKLDTATLRALNRRVEVYADNPADVAREWLDQEGPNP